MSKDIINSLINATVLILHFCSVAIRKNSIELINLQVQADNKGCCYLSACSKTVCCHQMNGKFALCWLMGHLLYIQIFKK